MYEVLVYEVLVSYIARIPSRNLYDGSSIIQEMTSRRKDQNDIVVHAKLSKCCIKAVRMGYRAALL